MTTVQIRNVPEQTVAVLRRRARESGRSLQEYLRMKLEAEASRPDNASLLAAHRAGLRGHSTATTDDIVAAIRADRESGHA